MLVAQLGEPTGDRSSSGDQGNAVDRVVTMRLDLGLPSLGGPRVILLAGEVSLGS